MRSFARDRSDQTDGGSRGTVGIRGVRMEEVSAGERSVAVATANEQLCAMRVIGSIESDRGSRGTI